MIRNGNLARLRLQTTMGTQSGYDVKASLEIPSQQSTGLPMQHLALAARFLANGLCDGTPDSAMLSECTEVGLVLAEWTESSMLMMRTKLQVCLGAEPYSSVHSDHMTATNFNVTKFNQRTLRDILLHIPYLGFPHHNVPRRVSFHPPVGLIACWMNSAQCV